VTAALEVAYHFVTVGLVDSALVSSYMQHVILIHLASDKEAKKDHFQ